ncbi:MAG: PDZ domain-containing protein, partial [Anaerolineae bacterium]
MTKRPGGAIAAVEPGSLGAEAGLEPGDRLLAINGHPLRDIIDVQFYSAEEALVLLVERDRAKRRVQIEREYGQKLGLAFVHPTFDRDIRRCANNCDFCFVKQNAPGMRRSLYVKDDDYRYSFLYGNFVTLTNLTDDDWARLEEQRLSPLYVSVHATDLALRRRFLARKDAPDVMEQLRRLADLAIEVHTQVVLVPDLNDGEHLTQSLVDLTALCGKPVASVGVVPVGLTKYHRGRCRTYTPNEARA